MHCTVEMVRPRIFSGKESGEKPSEPLNELIAQETGRTFLLLLKWQPRRDAPRFCVWRDHRRRRARTIHLGSLIRAEKKKSTFSLRLPLVQAIRFKMSLIDHKIEQLKCWNFVRSF